MIQTIKVILSPDPSVLCLQGTRMPQPLTDFRYSFLIQQWSEKQSPPRSSKRASCFSKILKKKLNSAKLLPRWFHLNGNSIDFAHRLKSETDTSCLATMWSLRPIDLNIPCCRRIIRCPRQQSRVLDSLIALFFSFFVPSRCFMLCIRAGL